jgi:hypothetical protein
MMLAIDIYLSHTSGLEFHLILDEVRVNFGLNSCSEGHARCNPNRETHLATSHSPPDKLFSHRNIAIRNLLHECSVRLIQHDMKVLHGMHAL